MKPILFNTEMVRAILEGRKTVTRRVVKIPGTAISMTVNSVCIKDGKAHFGWSWAEGISGFDVAMPYRPGDTLYVRESWCKTDCFGLQDGYIYKANDNSILEHTGFTPKWRPSIHMPREAARIFLLVTDVRVERLRDISMKDIRNEGIEYDIERPVASYGKFVERWDSTINPKNRALYGWDANPWVWVIEFERISKEEALKCE